MSAANTDKFKKLTNNFSTTLSGAIVGSGDSSMSLASTTNLPTDTGTVFVIDRVNSSGTATPTLREYVVGTVSGSNVTNLARGVGNSTAQAHLSGAVVEQVVDQRTINDIVDGLLVSHTQSGTMIPNLPLTTPQITTGIKDVNGATMNGYTATASAVNFVNDTNNIAGKDPIIAAAGTDSAIGLNLRGKGLAKTVNIGAGAVNIFAYDYVASGCVWTADAAGSTLNASMTAGVVVINGNPVTVALVTAHAFTASKDTYVDVLDNGDGTGLVVYTPLANNAASQALATNSIRIAIIVSGASNIAAATSINQGQETMVLPIVSSIPYAVTDSLGNLICPRDPNRKLLGYRQIIVNFTTASTTAVQVTGVSCPVIVPTGRKVKVKGYAGDAATSAGGAYVELSLWDGIVASGTLLNTQRASSDPANTRYGLTPEYLGTPAAASKTYNLGALVNGGTGTLTSNSATLPIFIKVELV